ncbi:MAG: SIS domain-containing protein [Saccharofermentanales bacterium]|jgi:fructoselysine-6-phosphate deglycase|nr:SIS domain-containing protein [Clostridiaceae bacterium]
MLNFNVPRFEKMVGDALAMREGIEKAVDEIFDAGYSNLFFIGTGGTFAHALPIKYWLDSETDIESHVEIASEFMTRKNRRFNKDSVCIFSTRSGTTKEIIQAAKFCQDRGARTFVYVSNPDTPIYEHADYIVQSYAEDDHLGEAIYLFMYMLLARLCYREGLLADYDAWMEKLESITPYLIKGKEQYDATAEKFAKAYKDETWIMVAGAGMMWGEAYDYAMCILEEMQWIRTKSIHSAEFFHGTLELVEEDTVMLVLQGDDEARPLTDRLLRFAAHITEHVTVFDTETVDLPFDDFKDRKLLSPMIIYSLLERLSRHLEHERNHPLTTRRYYRQFDY